MEKEFYKGFYKYQGKSLPKKMERVSTNFEIKITDSSDSNFNGIILDDTKSGGMPGKGTITGQYKNDEISFIKQMPNAGIYLPNGKVKILRQKHSPILYKGKRDNNGVIKGHWKMKFRLKVLGILTVPLGTTKGTWEMLENENPTKAIFNA